MIAPIKRLETDIKYIDRQVKKAILEAILASACQAICPNATATACHIKIALCTKFMSAKLGSLYCGQGRLTEIELTYGVGQAFNAVG